MKQPRFTHIARIYGFKCYFNEETNELQGTNWFNSKMIDLFTWIQRHFFNMDTFRIELIEEIKPNE